MPAHPIKAIIFDHDGTLVDSEAVHWQLWQTTIAPNSFSREQYDNQLAGVPSLESARWIKHHCQLDMSAEALLANKKTHLHAYFKERAFPMKAGALALLEGLHRANIPMAIASGAHESEIARTLEYHQIGHYFQSVVAGNQVNNNKPAPDVYQQAASYLGVIPEECLAIEDSDSGQIAAQKANMRCLRLNTYSRLEIDSAYLFDSLESMHHGFISRHVAGLSTC